MKIGEAYSTYGMKLDELFAQKRALIKEQKRIGECKGHDSDEYKSITLELSSVNEKFDKVHGFVNVLDLYRSDMMNAQAAKQNAEAREYQAKNMHKCMEIARRISKGGKVPPKDLQKLMEYDMELYMQALYAAAMNKNKSNKEYDSLFDDEDTDTSDEVATDVDDEELDMELPDIDNAE